MLIGSASGQQGEDEVNGVNGDIPNGGGGRRMLVSEPDPSGGTESLSLMMCAASMGNLETLLVLTASGKWQFFVLPLLSTYIKQVCVNIGRFAVMMRFWKCGLISLASVAQVHMHGRGRFRTTAGTSMQ